MTYDRMHTFQNVYFVPIDYSNSKFEPNYSSSILYNETVDLIYCRSGLIDLEILGENGKSKKNKTVIELGQKQFAIIDAGVKYKYQVKSLEPSVVLSIRLKLVPVKEYEYNAGALISVDIRGFFDKLEGLKRFTYNSDCYVSALDSGNLENTLVKYLHGLVGNEQDMAREINDLTNFLQALIELDKCLLPSTVSTGIIYIKKAQDYIFKAHVGMSVIQSLNNFRIEKCKQLLIDTNLTINEICARAGFNNRQHLIYEFKTQTGTTPSAFRDEFLNRSFIGGLK